MLTHFHTIAFTHRNLDVSAIGKLHIEAENQQDRFNPVKDQLNIDELLFLDDSPQLH